MYVVQVVEARNCPVEGEGTGFKTLSDGYIPNADRSKIRTLFNEKASEAELVCCNVVLDEKNWESSTGFWAKRLWRKGVAIRQQDRDRSITKTAQATQGTNVRGIEGLARLPPGCEAKAQYAKPLMNARRHCTTRTQGGATGCTGSSREHRQGTTSSPLQRRRVRVQTESSRDGRRDRGWNLRSTTRLRLERRKGTMRTRSQRTQNRTGSIQGM